MKKTFLALTFLSLGLGASYAQISKGGLPLSMLSNEAAVISQTVGTVSYQAPSLEKVLADDARASLSDPKPYRAGILVPTDFSFPQSGSMVTLADGRRIWRGKLSVTHAPAMVLYYDQFHLPEGVKLFVTNTNGKQVQGAFTSDDNAENGIFATPEVQGSVASVELDIDASVRTEDIALHINQAAYMYRSYNDVQAFAGDNDGSTAAKPTTDQFAGSGSSCEVNAVCPAGTGFDKQRKATVRILMPLGGGFVGFCSGTLINNTLGNCTPYVLTATHCEETNSTTNSTYNNFLFYFNLETSDCAGNQHQNGQAIMGATFVARSSYNPNNDAIVGDFLLLKLSKSVPANYNVYFAGWNRSATNNAGSTYIGFHHPAGDEKKLATGTNIAANGTFNQTTTANTHWYMQFATGGVEGGSSGSALFDQNGRIIGDLSGGPDVQYCTNNYFNSFGDTAIMSQYALYSKLSRNWEYPEGNGVATAQLKPWLDPSNAGVTTVDALAAAASCNSPATGTAINDVDKTFGNAISIYPNPVVSGALRMRINLQKQANVAVTLFDITGARKGSFDLKQVISGEYSFDLGAYPDGTYLMRISDGTAVTSRKVVIAR